MADFPATRASLHIRLRDPRDEAAWREFIELGEEVVLELISDSFVPQCVMDKGTNTDPRALGIQVRGIKLLRDEAKPAAAAGRIVDTAVSSWPGPGPGLSAGRHHPGVGGRRQPRRRGTETVGLGRKNGASADRTIPVSALGAWLTRRTAR